MAAYYNEHDPYAAQWLRNLISAGHIAPGDVDERSIEDVKPDDLAGYAQCHFFAGIGVWSLALRVAGWPDERPAYTGSCPCQPFSPAGKGAGFADERHLWPAFFHLISECRPSVVFGEQVAGRNGLSWLDLVQTDMEAVGYAVGAVPFPAAGFGAPHIRERLYWVAYADDARSQGRVGAELPERTGQCASGTGGSSSGLGHAEGDGRERRQDDGDKGRRECAFGQASAFERLEHTKSDGRLERQTEPSGRSAVSGCGVDVERPSPTNSFWRDADWLFCRDGKWRPVEARVLQVVNGNPIRVGRLRSDLTAKTEEILDEAAKRLHSTRAEILREVQEATGAKDFFWESGSSIDTQQAQILLTYLLEFAGQDRDFQNAKNGAGARGPERDLRVLWRERQTGNPPYQRRLERQPLRELADALHLLSSAVARSAQESKYPMLYEDAPASFPLCGGREGKAQNTLGNLSANRVGRLRAYGNAICAPQAQAFIEAAMAYRP